VIDIQKVKVQEYITIKHKKDLSTEAVGTFWLYLKCDEKFIRSKESLKI
jgi:hypothetical protein